jgi:Mg/Co/Ni transporter MgtE
MSESTQAVLPVVNHAGQPQGLLSLDTLRSFLFEESIGTVAVAHDCQQEFVALRLHDALSTALEHFMSSRCRQLPVVDEDNTSRIVGFLSYEDLLRAYDQELVRRGIKGENVTAPPLVPPVL